MTGPLVVANNQILFSEQKVNFHRRLQWNEFFNLIMHTSIVSTNDWHRFVVGIGFLQIVYLFSWTCLERSGVFERSVFAFSDIQWSDI